MVSARLLDRAYETYRADPAAELDPLLQAVLRKAQAVLQDDDQAQSFVIDIWDVLPSLVIERSFESWLNIRLRWHRSKAIAAANRSREEQAPMLHGEDDEPLTEGDVLDILAHRAAPRPDHEPDLDAIEDPFLRDVAALLLEGHTQAETAQQLGINPSTLRKRLQRFRNSAA